MLWRLEQSCKGATALDLEGSKGQRLWDPLELSLNFCSATYYQDVLGETNPGSSSQNEANNTCFAGLLQQSNTVSAKHLADYLTHDRRL